MLILAEQLAGGGTVAIILAVGLSLLSRLLFKPKPNTLLENDKPISSSQRGSFVPLVIGTRNTGAVFLWTGGSIIIQENTGSTGGKGIPGGGEAILENIFYGQAIQAFAVGPGANLNGISVGGEIIPNSVGLNKLSAPSGTTVSFGNMGSARIYWGEPDQPLSSMLTAALGIATRAPYIIRLEWDRLRLGTTDIWPLVEAIVEPVPTSGGAGISVDAIIEDADEKGINPAHIIWQLLTAPFPWGSGFSTNWVNISAITTLGDLAVAENIGMNLLIQNGDPVDKILGEVLQDFGTLLPLCNGVFSPFAIRRYTDPIETLLDEMLLPPVEEIEKQHISISGDALVYEYIDADQNYRTATIDLDDDSAVAIRNQRKTKKIPLSTITHRPTASKVVNRLSLQDLNNLISPTISGLRNLRQAVPGQPFNISGIGVVRVMTVTPDMESPKVKIELLKDIFDTTISSYEDPDLPDQDFPSGDLEPDIRYVVIETPRLFSGNQNFIAVGRHRANQSIVGANILASGDDITYELVGPQNISATGGLVESDWKLPRVGYINTFTSLRITIDATGDEDSIVNLAALPTNWISGGNYMIVYRPTILDSEGSITREEEWELFYIQNFSLISGNVYEATGIIQNRFDTKKTPIANRFQDHQLRLRSFLADDNCEVYIIAKTNLTPATGGIVSLGGVLFSKSQPINAQGTLPAAASGRFDVDFTNESLRPIHPAWAQAGGDYGKGGLGDLSNEYTDDPTFDEDLVIEWAISDPVHGAGQQGAGQATPSLTPEGFIQIEVYFATTSDQIYFLDDDIRDDANVTIVRTENFLLSSLTKTSRGTYQWNYSRLDRVSDGIQNANFWHHFVAGVGDPDFQTNDHNMQISITHIVNSVPSDSISVRPVELYVGGRFYN